MENLRSGAGRVTGTQNCKFSCAIANCFTLKVYY